MVWYMLFGFSALALALILVQVFLYRLPEPEDGPEITILLAGAAGNGRSALGNNILGRRVFESRLSAKMVTKRSEMARVEIGPRKLFVIDTPGLLGDGDMIDTKDVIESLNLSLTLRPKGISAFIIVMNQVDRITKEELDAIKILHVVFGDSLFTRAIFVFTHKDLWKSAVGKDQNINEELAFFIDNLPSEMAQSLNRAGERVLYANSLETNSLVNRIFHVELINTIDRMMRIKGYKRYTIQDFENAQDILKYEIRNKLEEEARQERERDEQIWKDALATCRCPTKLHHTSEYKLNLNIKFPGSGYIMAAIDYLFGGFQTLLGWVGNTPLLN